ncbi:MAG: LysR family transcriptional regulator [Thermoleophilaceae bacterium]|nr:LysR family transcriptional regulator [Thermoleophilaceae bacterium]
MVPRLSKAFEIQRLRVLVEVARLGSVSKAAEALGLTQPTVSLHLKALNRTLGVPMVEREGRGIRLTEAGRLLEHHARRALSELERAQQALANQRDLTTGSLRVGAGVSVGTYLFPEIVRDFADEHPSIELGVEVGSSGVVAEMLDRGELDLGVLGEVARHPDLELRQLASLPIVCIVGPDSKCAESGTVSREQLRSSTLLARRNGSSTQRLVDRHLASMRVTPADRWGFETPEAIKGAAMAGLGIALISELSVRAELADGRLVKVDLEGGDPPAIPVQVVRSVHHAPSPAERAFLELLESRIA